MEAEESARMALDIFETKGIPKPITKTKWVVKNVLPSGFYESGEVTVLICESAGRGHFILKRGVQTINIIPEMLLGAITLGIGIVGTATSIVSNEPTGVLSMAGFVIAGLATIIGSSFLKKRFESA